MGGQNKKDLKEVRWQHVDWIYLAQERGLLQCLVTTGTLWFHKKAGNFLTTTETIIISSTLLGVQSTDYRRGTNYIQKTSILLKSICY